MSMWRPGFWLLVLAVGGQPHCQLMSTYSPPNFKSEKKWRWSRLVSYLDSHTDTDHILRIITNTIVFTNGIFVVIYLIQKLHENNNKHNTQKQQNKWAKAKPCLFACLPAFMCVRT